MEPVLQSPSSMLSRAYRRPIASRRLSSSPHPSGMMVDVGGAMQGRQTQGDKTTVKPPRPGIKIERTALPFHRKPFTFLHFIKERVSAKNDRHVQCFTAAVCCPVARVWNVCSAVSLWRALTVLLRCCSADAAERRRCTFTGCNASSCPISV